MMQVEYKNQLILTRGAPDKNQASSFATNQELLVTRSQIFSYFV
jgi:hypothetical protein